MIIELKPSYSEVYGCCHCRQNWQIYQLDLIQEEGVDQKSHIVNRACETLNFQGWIRLGNIFFKDQVLNSCCYQVNSRINISEFTITKRQLRLCERIKFIFSHEMILQQDIPVEQRFFLLSCAYDKTLTENLQGLQKENQRQVKQHSAKKGQEKQGLDAKGAQEVRIYFESMFDNINKLAIKKEEELLQSLKSYLCQTERPIQFQFQIPQDWGKLFIFPSDQKDSYFTNYLMLLYNQNSGQFIKGFKLKQFIKVTRAFFLTLLLDENYNFQILDSGYLIINYKSLTDPVAVDRNNHEKNQQSAVKGMTKEKPQQLTGKTPSRSCYPIPELITKITKEGFQIGHLRVVIEEQNYQKEHCNLYLKFIQKIHGTIESKMDYKTFRVQSPYLYEVEENPEAKIPKVQKGTLRMCYYLEHELIAIGIVDNLNKIFNSYQFFYKPKLKPYSLGVFSIIVELLYCKYLQESQPSLQYYTLGQVTPFSNKFSYKASFNAVHVQCPISYTWLGYDREIKNRVKQIAKTPCQQRTVFHLTESSEPTDLFDIDIDMLNILYEGKRMKFSEYKELLGSDCQDQASQLLKFAYMIRCEEVLPIITFKIQKQ